MGTSQRSVSHALRLGEAFGQGTKGSPTALGDPDIGKQLSAHRCNNTDKSARLKSFLWRAVAASGLRDQQCESLSLLRTSP